MQNPEIAALIAIARRTEPLIERTPTGEPCRCPEHVLDCVCGAYR